LWILHCPVDYQNAPWKTPFPRHSIMANTDTHIRMQARIRGISVRRAAQL